MTGFPKFTDYFLEDVEGELSDYKSAMIFLQMLTRIDLKIQKSTMMPFQKSLRRMVEGLQTTRLGRMILQRLIVASGCGGMCTTLDSLICSSWSCWWVLSRYLVPRQKEYSRS